MLGPFQVQSSGIQSVLPTIGFVYGREGKLQPFFFEKHAWNACVVVPDGGAMKGDFR